MAILLFLSSPAGSLAGVSAGGATFRRLAGRCRCRCRGGEGEAETEAEGAAAAAAAAAGFNSAASLAGFFAGFPLPPFFALRFSAHASALAASSAFLRSLASLVNFLPPATASPFSLLPGAEAEESAAARFLPLEGVGPPLPSWVRGMLGAGLYIMGARGTGRGVG